MTEAEEKIQEEKRWSDQRKSQKMQTKLKDFEVSENLAYELEAYNDTLKHEHHQSKEDQMLLYCWEMFQLYASFYE